MIIINRREVGLFKKDCKKSISNSGIINFVFPADILHYNPKYPQAQNHYPYISLFPTKIKSYNLLFNATYVEENRQLFNSSGYFGR